MAGEMFGTPIGRSQADADMAKMAMTQAQVQHMGMQDLMVPGQMEQRAAQSRYLNSRAGALEAEADMEKRVAAMASGRKPTVEVSRNPVWDFAEMYKEAGSLTKAMKAANIAATIDSKQASASTQTARQALIEGRTRLVQIDELSRGVRDVTGPEELQAALQRHEQTTGEQTGLLDPQGNLLPQAVDNWESIRDKTAAMALTERDRLAADIRERQLESSDKIRKARITNMEFWQNFDNQRRRAEAVRKPVIEKAGALDKVDDKLGTNFVASQFLGLEPAQTKIYGRQVAERAQALRQQNPALTPTEAVQNAFEAMNTSGDFQGLKRVTPQAKESEKRPLPLPADAIDTATNKGDTSKLKVGFWYTDGKSKSQWLGPGKGWSHQHSKGTIRPAGAKAMPNYTTGNTSDEDDLEEDTTTEDDNMALED